MVQPTGRSPKTSWMGNTLPIAEYQIRVVFKLFHSLKENRNFSKTQQSGDIRELCSSLNPFLFQPYKRRVFKDHNTGPYAVGVFRGRNISTRNGFHLFGQWPQMQFLSKLFLNFNGIGRGNIPSMELVDSHPSLILRMGWAKQKHSRYLGVQGNLQIHQ